MPPTSTDTLSFRDVAHPTRSLHVREQIDNLYSGTQCSETGLRFADPEKLRQHKDEFFKKQQLAFGLKSRAWDVPCDQWVRLGTEHREEVTPPRFFEADGSSDEAEEEDKVFVPADCVSSDSCALCRERFDKVWSDDHEGWLYVGAAIESAQAVHAKCATVGVRKMPAVQSLGRATKTRRLNGSTSRGCD